MSLSEELRAELAAVEPTRDCDRLAELSGLFHTAGSEHLLGRGAVALHLDLPTAAVARRGFSLLSHFGIVSEIRSYRRPAFQRETRYQLHVAGDARALQVLNEAGVLSATLAPLERPPKRVVGRACCRSAYLRGALLGGGSLGAACAASRDPQRVACGRRVRGAGRSGSGRAPARARPRATHDRVCEGSGSDRRRPGRRRSRGCSHPPRRTSGDGSNASPSKPPRERRPRQPGPHEPSRPCPTPGRKEAQPEAPAAENPRGRRAEIGKPNSVIEGAGRTNGAADNESGYA